jgi:hypothetical protein
MRRSRAFSPATLAVSGSSTTQGAVHGSVLLGAEIEETAKDALEKLA